MSLLDESAAPLKIIHMHRQLLFLCTGNYYRSRFAEHLFNWLAERHELRWRAFSRGLALDRGSGNVGPMSRNALRALRELGVPLAEPLRFPAPLGSEDLARAARIIALKEAEHRPLLTERHHGWQDRVEYWHVHDVDLATPEDGMAKIRRHVAALVAGLQQAHSKPAPTRGEPA